MDGVGHEVGPQFDVVHNERCDLGRALGELGLCSIALAIVSYKREIQLKLTATSGVVASHRVLKKGVVLSNVQVR